MITHWYQRYGKRLFDILLSSGGLLFFAIPMGWFAVQIRRKMGSPALFRQKRVGRNGALFTILKFRTMSGENVVPSAFCQWLRATALDELPQLINILKGDMSFVGPRPLIPEELTELSRVPGGNIRLSVLPGLAGLAQIYGTKTPTLAQRTRWDITYIRQCSFPLDIRILFKSLRITSHGSWDDSGSKGA